MTRCAVLGAALLLACTDRDERAPPPVADAVGARSGAPVLLNAESPVGYPPVLYREQVEGTVVLRLFLDRDGRIVPESTRVAEGSGYDALDSAALDAVAHMRFAPVQRDGQAVATAFLQSVHFQHPARSGSPGVGQ